MLQADSVPRSQSPGKSALIPKRASSRFVFPSAASATEQTSQHAAAIAAPKTQLPPTSAGQKRHLPPSKASVSASLTTNNGSAPVFSARRSSLAAPRRNSPVPPRGNSSDENTVVASIPTVAQGKGAHDDSVESQHKTMAELNNTIAIQRSRLDHMSLQLDSQNALIAQLKSGQAHQTGELTPTSETTVMSSTNALEAQRKMNTALKAKVQELHAENVCQRAENQMIHSELQLKNVAEKEMLEKLSLRDKQLEVVSREVCDYRESIGAQMSQLQFELDKANEQLSAKSAGYENQLQDKNRQITEAQRYIEFLLTNTKAASKDMDPLPIYQA
ncbi:hypothetical protein BC830DRAFT_1164082 [Chytriomyces sp. MP71]|nr:hypothetical protein BC830DRAFT_1164082 [Chytriomyces sp. MP71]